MKQESPLVDLDVVVRQRIRSLRLARGWSLDTLAARCFLSPSTLSRLETGHRRMALDQLVPIARALGTSIDQLVEPIDDTDVVIRPEPQQWPGRTTWILSRDRAVNGVTVAKMRIEPTLPDSDRMRVHPGHDWFTVLSGTLRLRLGDRTIFVESGDAAEFSTMIPHCLAANDVTTEVLTIFDREGERAHLHTPADEND
ncbi:helix-turn-helix domain-containing protein [Gordonia sp. CPCC 205333]|uniref:helix-turn-helix domain-containing protein n=1 Tax=Gordonia sp. CPCC 205333 TaxID=3140790 RepID=UPI003AF3918E